MLATAMPDNRGILVPAARDVRFRLSRRLPAPDVAAFVEWYWIVRWELEPGATHPQETLPQPVAHLVLRRGHSALHGVMTRRFRIVLEGKGQAFGVRFRPGGCRPFLGCPLAEITDADIGIGAVLGRGEKTLERRILLSEDDADEVAMFEEHLRPRLPARDPVVDDVAAIVSLALSERDITRVEQLVERTQTPLRALQRLFRNYVGVSPKWVIRRARMTEAAERVGRRALLSNSGGKPTEFVSWADFATELGYFDQAHFIRDFRAQIGSSPGDYAAACLEAEARLRQSQGSDLLSDSDGKPSESR